MSVERQDMIAQVMVEHIGEAVPLFADLADSKQVTVLTHREIAGHIGGIIGRGVLEYGAAIDEGPRPYYIPSTTLNAEQARALDIEGPDDFFGGILEVRDHRDKAIFHPLVAEAQEEAPAWYSEVFARRVEEAVLPGYSVFSIDDARAALADLNSVYGTVRAKDPTASGSVGQFVIESPQQLDELLGQLEELESGWLTRHGFVLEPNLIEPVTLSIGQVRLGGETHAYIGEQSETTYLDGKPTYGGTTLTMVRGGFDKLSTVTATIYPDYEHVVKQTGAVVTAFEEQYGLIASRINFDAIFGDTSTGIQLAGICDQSFRIGGATPAEVLAVKALLDNPQATQVTARNTVGWRHGVEGGDWPQAAHDEIVFFAGAHLRQTASLVTIDNPA